MAGPRLKFMEPFGSKGSPSGKHSIIYPLKVKLFEARELVTDVEDQCAEYLVNYPDLKWDLHCARRALSGIYRQLWDECDSLIREKDDELVAMNTAEWEESEEKMKQIQLHSRRRPPYEDKVSSANMGRKEKKNGSKDS